MGYAVIDPDKEIRTFRSIVEAMTYWFDSADADPVVREAVYSDIADCLVHGDESVYSIGEWTIGLDSTTEALWGHTDIIYPNDGEVYRVFG